MQPGHLHRYVPGAYINSAPSTHNTANDDSRLLHLQKENIIIETIIRKYYKSKGLEQKGARDMAPFD